MDASLAAIVQSVLSACILGLMGYVAKRVAGVRSDMGAIRDSQRNQLKASIVRSANEALAQGWIYATELETLTRRFESYSALGGNSYVATLMRHVNDLELRGELPAHE